MKMVGIFDKILKFYSKIKKKPYSFMKIYINIISTLKTYKTSKMSVDYCKAYSFNMITIRVLNFL